MAVVMILVFAPPVSIAVPVAIPFVAMLKAASIAFPVAVEIESALVAWTNPAGAGIRSASPIAVNPDKVGARRGRWLNYHARRGRRTNPDAHTDLRACAIGAEQQNRGNQRESHEAFHISLISFRRPTNCIRLLGQRYFEVPCDFGMVLAFGDVGKRVGRTGSPSNRGKAVGERWLPRNCRAAVPLVSSMKFARSGRNSFAWLDFVARNRPKRDSCARNDGARR